MYFKLICSILFWQYLVGFEIAMIQLYEFEMFD
jgi:hypothetical protein